MPHRSSRALTRTAGQVHGARLAVFVVFALNGLAYATWASRIPELQRVLQLTPGELGTTLLVGAAGSLVTLPLTGRLIERVGTATTVRLGVVGVAAGLVLITVAASGLQSRAALAVSLFVAMASIGVWDVAMNHEGSVVEQALGRPTMPLFHALFSGGTVLGALLAVLLLRLQVPLAVHLPVVALVVLGIALAAPARFLPSPPGVGRGAPPDDLAADSALASPAPTGRSAWREPRTLIIGLVVLVAALTEGTANDWLAVAVSTGHEQPEWVGVLAFAIFLSSMTLGRVLGVRLLARHGRVPVLRVLFVLAAVGSLVVVLAPMPWALAGAVLWGVGASLGFPVGMSAASDDPARAAARLSVVSTIGYLAFLAGPPALGLLGDHVGVLPALLVVGALAVPALLCLPAVREPSQGPGTKGADARSMMEP